MTLPIMSDRKKPTAGFWITVAVVAVLVAYPLSFGPACWITSRCSIQGDWLLVVYRPMLWLLKNGPDFLFYALSWYSLVGVADGWGWEIDNADHWVAFIKWR